MTWRREDSWLYSDSNSGPSVVQPVASRYTDYAIPALNYNWKIIPDWWLQLFCTQYWYENINTVDTATVFWCPWPGSIIMLSQRMVKNCVQCVFQFESEYHRGNMFREGNKWVNIRRDVRWKDLRQMEVWRQPTVQYCYVGCGTVRRTWRARPCVRFMLLFFERLKIVAW
jgi:hypothetical protein